MLNNERLARRPSFKEGAKVWLSDGQPWTLPPCDPSRDEPDYTALLRAIEEAETRFEGLRLELALTIFLLNRNYALSPERLNDLLCFSPDDPAVTVFQRDVHRFVLAQFERCPPALLPRPNAARVGGLSGRLSPHDWVDRIRSAVSYRIS